jgi:hypothetical protein
MPNVATVDEIKNMTPDQFLDYVELYLKEGNAEQLFTLHQIWLKYNKDLFENPYFLDGFGSKYGKMAGAMERLLGPKFQELASMMDVLKMEKANSHRLKAHPSYTKEEKIDRLDRGISSAEREIRDLQRYIENSRRELQSLRSSM